MHFWLKILLFWNKMALMKNKNWTLCIWSFPVILTSQLSGRSGKNWTHLLITIRHKRQLTSRSYKLLRCFNFVWHVCVSRDVYMYLSVCRTICSDVSGIDLVRGFEYLKTADLVVTSQSKRPCSVVLVFKLAVLLHC